MKWRAEFERLKHHIEAALAYNAGTQTLAQVYEGLESGTFHLWAGQDSVLITEVARLPNKTLLTIVLGGGNLNEIQSLVRAVEKAAKQANYQGVMIVGRRGWQRVLPGYAEKAVIVIKEL